MDARARLVRAFSQDWSDAEKIVDTLLSKVPSYDVIRALADHNPDSLGVMYGVAHNERQAARRRRLLSRVDL